MTLRLFAVIAVILLTGCANSTQSSNGLFVGQPEGASGFSEKPGWSTKKFAVAAANPLAANAGYQILKAGGSAIDAAVAVQMVLTLVEPQSSGIGGGGFLLHFNGHVVRAFDGRETAPAAADENLFIGSDGKPLAFIDAVLSGRSVGVPGTVRMLELAHQQYGKLPWSELIQPAITLAQDGFKVSPRLHSLLKSDTHLKKDPTAASYFFNSDGEPVAQGATLRNPALASVLKIIAVQGSKGLHEGVVAQAIVDKVQTHPTNPGLLTLNDLASYRALQREPICHDHTARNNQYRVCGFPPPSSGAIAVGQILGILNSTHAANLPLPSATDGVTGNTLNIPSEEWLHLYTEASRLAFADRAQFLGDPDFVSAPAGNWEVLLDPSYLASRASLIDQRPDGQSMKVARPGNPGSTQSSYAPMPEQLEFGTSHISIVDPYGNAVAMTTSIENQFGARLMTNGGSGQVGGFLLNNQLTDFSFAPADSQGLSIANRVQAGKRPRSSMSPTIVLDKSTGQLVMSGGSPGGDLIIHYIAKTLYGVLNWRMNVQQAINLPNFASLNGASLLEENRFPITLVEKLKRRGALVRELPMTSGLQAIERTPEGFFGGADPRREGIVLGD